MRARIELVGCLTHTARRPCVKGKPFYTTNASDIAYFQAQGVFSVTVLEEDKPKKAKAAKPKAKKAAPPPPEPEPDEPEEGDEGDGDEGDGDDEDEGDDLTVPSYTKSDLEATKKADLQALAADEFDLSLDPDKMSKKEMVAAIIKAQIERLEAGDEE